ncbi:MAG: ABC transporter permease [Fimbriimonadaceae bacterium]|nr:ABC transporter permease [Fimbriimonadaceae bacterium]
MKRLDARLLWPLAALGAVLAFNLVATPGFFDLAVRDGRLYGSLVDVVNRAVPVLLLGFGMTLVIATAGVDLSVGAVMAIAGAVAACLIVRPEGCVLNALPVHSLAGIVAVSLGVALLCGVFNGLLVAVFRIQPIVATLLLMVAGRGIAQLLTNGQIVTFQSPAFGAIGSGATLGVPNPVWIAACVFGVGGLLVRGTAYGMFVEAVGSNPVASRLSGIDARGVKMAAYAVCAVCAGIAGLIAAADIRAADANNAGLYLELDAILAVSVGGTSLAGGRFSLVGTILGALLMQALATTIFTRGVSAEGTLVLKALVVVAVCVLQSGPLKRPRRAEARRA